jgi:hypothetical protein
MRCIGYGEAKADEGSLSIDRAEPLIRLEFAALIRATFSHKGRRKEATLALISAASNAQR